MNWICVGFLAGSIIASGHETKEACEGRAVTLRESKAIVKCVEVTNASAFGTASGSITIQGYPLGK